MQFELYPSKRYVQVLMPRTCECDFNLEIGSLHTQPSSRILSEFILNIRWALNAVAGVLTGKKGGKRQRKGLGVHETETQGRSHGKTEAEIGELLPQAKGQLEQRSCQRPFLRVLGGCTAPLTSSLDFRHLASTTLREQVSVVLSHLVCGDL